MDDDRKPSADSAPAEDPHKGQKIAVGDTAGASARGSERVPQLKYVLPPDDNEEPPLYTAISNAIVELLDPMLNMLDNDEGKELYNRCHHFRRYICNVANAQKTHAWIHRDPVLQLMAFMAKMIGEHADGRKDAELKKMADALYTSASSPTGALQSGTEGAVAYALYCDPSVDRHSVKMDVAVVAFLKWLKLGHDDEHSLVLKCRYCEKVWKDVDPKRKDAGFLNNALFCAVVDHYVGEGMCQPMCGGRRSFIGKIAGGRVETLKFKAGFPNNAIKNFVEARLTAMRYVFTRDQTTNKYRYDFGHQFTREEMAFVDIAHSKYDYPFDITRANQAMINYNDPRVKEAIGYNIELLQTEDIPSVLSEDEGCRRQAKEEATDKLKSIRDEFEGLL